MAGRSTVPAKLCGQMSQTGVYGMVCRRLFTHAANSILPMMDALRPHVCPGAWLMLRQQHRLLNPMCATMALVPAAL